MGLSEPELRTLCHHGDPRLSELACLAQALRVPPTHFLNGSLLQAGIGNTQKIKIGKAGVHELAEQLGVCRRALEQSQQLVAAKNSLNKLACMTTVHSLLLITGNGGLRKALPEQVARKIRIEFVSGSRRGLGSLKLLRL